jgi:DNA primase
MSNENFVLGLLESFLGKGKSDKKNNYSFSCPFCNHHKPKLVVNVKTGKYNCWTCEPPTKGNSPVSLLVKLKAPREAIQEMKGYFENDRTNLDQVVNYEYVRLPREFSSMTVDDGSLDYKLALGYLKSRGLTTEDIIKYNIGFCKSGRYSERVVIPSYDSQGKLTYFMARSYSKTRRTSYDAPSCNKEKIIGFESTINWNVPVILCEGVFDAIAIKRNAIPLFGKNILHALMLKLVSSQVKTIYLALDTDALKRAMVHAETLLNYGKEVYLLELDGKDPSNIGFEKMISLLHRAKPLTLSDLLYKKMELV